MRASNRKSHQKNWFNRNIPTKIIDLTVTLSNRYILPTNNTRSNRIRYNNMRASNLLLINKVKVNKYMYPIRNTTGHSTNFQSPWKFSVTLKHNHRSKNKKKISTHQNHQTKCLSDGQPRLRDGKVDWYDCRMEAVWTQGCEHLSLAWCYIESKAILHCLLILASLWFYFGMISLNKWFIWRWIWFFFSLDSWYIGSCFDVHLPLLIHW